MALLFLLLFILVGIDVKALQASQSSDTQTTSNSNKMITIISHPSKVYDNPNVQRLIIPKEIDFVLDEMYYEIDPWLVKNFSSVTPNCPNLEYVQVEEGNETFTSKDGVLYSKDMTILYYCPPGKKGELIVPEGVTKIELMAFQECAKLTAIHLPSTLTYVSGAAFGGNTSLKILTIAEECPSYKTESNVLFTKNGELLVTYAGGKTNRNYTVPKDVKMIGNTAFKGSTHLTKLSTQENFTTVGIEAFRDCTNLREVNFVEGLSEIYAGAFLNCTKLYKVTLPNGTRLIAQDAFTGCNKLLDISLPESLLQVENDIYNVPNRCIRIYNPYLDTYSFDMAKGVTVYTYRGSHVFYSLMDKGIPIYYLDEPYGTVSETTKAPKGAIKGKGKADTSWYNEADSVYNISNPDQLAGLSTLVNNGVNFLDKEIVLTKDLDLSSYPNWQPIGTWSQYGSRNNRTKAFMGSFDGNNHVIYNLRISRIHEDYQGLFGINKGNIKDLFIRNADILAKSYVGILSGYSDNGSISNCHISGVVKGYEKVGGLIGQCSISISQCTVDVNVYGISNVGGISGYGSPNLVDCTNSGRIIGYDGVGGYNGYTTGGSISNCVNQMTVSGDINVGGLSGKLRGEGLVSNCRNKGTVSGREKVGGIAGAYTFDGEIMNCNNEGNVFGTYYVGGIAGYLSIGRMENCNNYGEVKGRYGVGGVLGMLGHRDPIIDRVFNCTNSGMIDGLVYTDQIIGKDMSIFGTFWLPDIY
jgi:hypothetical protein